MIFYRSYWCPVCNKHLNQIQDSLKLITDKGVTVIAVSPEKPEYLEKLAGNSNDGYKLRYHLSGMPGLTDNLRNEVKL